MDRWFPLHPNEPVHPSLEEVFGFVDVIVRYREDLALHYSAGELDEIRDAMIKCIHYAVHSARREQPDNYRRFWTTVADQNRNVSVITLNYDSALEEAFDPLYPGRALIDYSIPFINYDNPTGIDAFNWWVNPREPLPRGAENTVPIKVLKLHGSLNWKYCRACRGVLLTPWDSAIDLETGRFLRTEGGSCDSPAIRTFENRCPHCDTSFETLILPPTHAKDLVHPVVSQIINEAIREVRSARRVIFVGYSFPEADVHIRALFARSLRTRDVVVVDPGLSIASRARYYALSPDVRFVCDDFAAFVASGDLAKCINSAGESA